MTEAEGRPSGREPKYEEDAAPSDTSNGDADWREAGDDAVEEASEESFPASDPPSYTTGQRTEPDEEGKASATP